MQWLFVSINPIFLGLKMAPPNDHALTLQPPHFQSEDSASRRSVLCSFHKVFLKVY